MLLFIAKTFWAKETGNKNQKVLEGGCTMQFMIKAMDGENFPSRADLNSYLASAPYVVENVWEKIGIETINVVIGGK